MCAPARLSPACSTLQLPTLSFHVCFFFNDTATTEIYTLSLHDALPIYWDLDHPAPEGSPEPPRMGYIIDRKSTRLNSSHLVISYAVFCLKKIGQAGSGFARIARYLGRLRRGAAPHIL